MSRLNPKNREEAFVYQFQDDIKLLHSAAHLSSEKHFKEYLETLKMHIKAYEKPDKIKK